VLPLATCLFLCPAEPSALSRLSIPDLDSLAFYLFSSCVLQLFSSSALQLFSSSALQLFSSGSHLLPCLGECFGYFLRFAAWPFRPLNQSITWTRSHLEPSIERSPPKFSFRHPPVRSPTPVGAGFPARTGSPVHTSFRQYPWDKCHKCLYLCDGPST